VTLPGLGDPLAELGLSPATNDTLGDSWSPDNWLVSQVEQLATPALPAAGATTRNEPHTVTAPMGAATSGGTLATAIDAAMSKLGTMYDWGGTGVNGRGVDCSGLIYYAYRAAGYNLPRYRAVDYGRMGVAVDPADARAGDIVYHDNPGSDTDHVGIYLGNGRFLEAPQPGEQVQISSLAGRGMTIRRIVPESAYRGMPRSPAGNVTYTHNNTVYESAKAPGPQHDPLDVLSAMEDPSGVSAMVGLPPDIVQGIAAKTPVSEDGKPATSFNAFLKAVAGQESGGDYSVRNSVGAIGKYQVMYYNVGPWTLQALGRSMSPEEFRDSPAAQDAVAKWRLGSYVAKYGYRGAAAAWYSGNPNRADDYKDVSNGPSVGDYVDQVLARMGT
jgi:cell wall-associated NlpC family hydrolase